MTKELGVKKVLLVTDKGIVEPGLLDKVKQPLEKEGILTAIFADVKPNNYLEVVEDSAQAAKES